MMAYVQIEALMCVGGSMTQRLGQWVLYSEIYDRSFMRKCDRCTQMFVLTAERLGVLLDKLAVRVRKDDGFKYDPPY